MEKVLVFKIRHNDGTKWENWCKDIQEKHLSDALECLIEEKVHQELFVTFRIEGQLYGVVIIDGVGEIPNQHREFVHIHSRKVEEELSRVGEGKVLYNIRPHRDNVSYGYKYAW